MKLHSMHVENHPCDCEANDCHGDTVHHLMCSCGFRDSTVIYNYISEMVRDHSPDWETYKQAMKDTRFPRYAKE